MTVRCLDECDWHKNKVADSSIKSSRPADMPAPQ